MLSSNGVKRSWRRMRRNRKDHRKYPYAIYRELTLWNPPSEYNERYIYQILGQRLASKYKSCLKFIYFLQFFSNIVEWAFSKQCCLLQIVRILIVVNFYKRKWWWNPVLRQVKMCADVFAGHANMLSLDCNFMHCVWEQECPPGTSRRFRKAFGRKWKGIAWVPVGNRFGWPSTLPRWHHYWPHRLASAATRYPRWPHTSRPSAARSTNITSSVMLDRNGNIVGEIWCYFRKL